MGYTRYPGAFIPEATAAIRAVWLQVRRVGLEEESWGWTRVPDAGFLPEMLALGERVKFVFGDGEWEPPHVLLRWSDSTDDPRSEVQYEPHVDRTPDGGLYYLVVGVALTDAQRAIEVDGDVLALRLGDAVAWSGDTIHRGILNTTHEPRVAVYFRAKELALCPPTYLFPSPSASQWNSSGSWRSRHGRSALAPPRSSGVPSVSIRPVNP